jgi:hypothetical protein
LVNGASRPARNLPVPRAIFALSGVDSSRSSRRRTGVCEEAAPTVRGEDVEEALHARADIGVEEIDGDVRAAIRRRRNTPENQNAEEKPAEIVAVGNLHGKELAQQHRDEDVDGDDAGSALLPALPQ